MMAIPENSTTGTTNANAIQTRKRPILLQCLLWPRVAAHEPRAASRPPGSFTTYGDDMTRSIAVLQTVSKSVGDGRARRTLLSEVDLDVRSGELVAVVGPSGCGKSTLLHLLGGLDRADSGSVRVLDVPLESCSDAQLVHLRGRHIGFIFQFFHLLPELTGFENVMLPARLARGRGGSVEDAMALVERLGVADAASRLPGVLSGGEQQRLAIARALVNRPSLILADEPTGNLDEESGAEVRRLIRELAGEDRAVVLVTHDAAAAALADRVFHLRHGRLQQ
jgi:ABC-type lipoprotein export system ATPase subunit